jgi:hypothetical protein
MMCLSTSPDDDITTMSRSAAGATRTVTCNPPKTKIWEGGTKDDIRISKAALFKGVSTRFGLRTIEKSIENQDVIFVSPSQIFVWEACHCTVRSP